MGDRVTQLAAARDTAPVFFMTFMRLRAQNRDSLICFFEGEDRKYFGIRLDLLLTNTKWIGIDCGGKKNVLDLYRVVRESEAYRDSLIAGFVDRDFDEPLEEKLREDIYETPSYSVENFYCSETCINRIFSIEFKLDLSEKNDNLLTDAIADFENFRDKFHEIVRPFNLWIFAHRRKEKTAGMRKLNLKNVELSQFIRISHEGVRPEISVENFSQFFPGCYEINQADLDECDPLLPVLPDGFNYRGKYEIEFIRKYLEKLRFQCSKKDSTLFNPGISIKLTLSKGNFISEISQYADTREDLKKFLANIDSRSRRVDESKVLT